MDDPKGSGTLEAILDTVAVRKLADARTFARGSAYAARGCVEDIETIPAGIRGIVRGNEAYSVRITAQDGTILHRCSCPVGKDGIFCKHCVALGLVWLSRGATPRTARSRAHDRGVTRQELQAWLESLQPPALAGIILELSDRDVQLMRRLKLKAVQGRDHEPRIATFRDTIDRATHVADFVDYHDAGSFARGIHEVIDEIRTLLAAGHADEVILLAEHALARVSGVIEKVDDSDGELSTVLARLQDLHLEACTTSSPDPEELARRLFEWELEGEWDIFIDAAAAYAAVLGEKGLAVYRELAEAKWATIPTLAPGDQDRGRDSQRFAITRIMETLARQRGSIEALVEVKRRDLGSPFAFYEIAKLYADAGDVPSAVTWAEVGVLSFPIRTDLRLRMLLAEAYEQQSRPDDAMALIWAEFCDHPETTCYELLRTHARRCGQWPDPWRERAIALLRERLAAIKPAKHPRWDWQIALSNSTLVEVFLLEGDTAGAWREAQAGGCADLLWERLAAAVAADNPDGAVATYRRLVERTLEAKNNAAYRHALGLVRAVSGVLALHGREAEFTPYLAALRNAHKAKRNFVKMLDQATWA